MTISRNKQLLITDRHALGHPEIDFDHFAIADCWLRTMRAEPVALPLHIARLRKLMLRHFEHEANLVEATGTRFCLCHRREHDAMLSLCEDAYEMSYRNGRAALMRLRRLPRLVRDHIICMDQIAVLIINTARQNHFGVHFPPKGQ